MDQPINIGIVEDQFLFREGMKSILESFPGCKVVFESADGYSVLSNLSSQPLVPDVMLVDLSLPPDGNRVYGGLDLTADLLKAYPNMKILILSVHTDENFIVSAIEQGAHGYLIKDSDPQEVREAIHSVWEKGSYINTRSLKALQNSIGKKVKPPKLNLPITKREVEILQLTCQQYTAEEIGERLFISTKTVNGHRNNLLLKTGSRNVAGLVMYAIRHQLVELV